MIRFLEGMREVFASHTAMGLFSGMTIYSATQITDSPILMAIGIAVGGIGAAFSVMTEMSDA